MNTVESIPEAKLLLSALRSVGYSEETAIADLLDNCISAGATKVSVVFDWDKQRITISDNGIGMKETDLYENMRIGSSDPEAKRDISDLGRFGMGMKTAAFSLGRKLTVISKKDNAFCNATWDLDKIQTIGWNLIVEDETSLSENYCFLEETNGTLIIIETLDRIIDASDMVKAKKHFYSMIDKVNKHISLVFHRFMTEEGISFFVNGKQVVPWDPFITANSATQELPDETVWSEETQTEVYIQPYVLPYKTKYANEDEYKAAGGIKGWNYHQGVYIYRNKRLIVCGSWFDYIKKEPAFNLARIKVDITSDCDSEWKIDIKKSTAAIPLFAKEAIERSIEVCTESSAKVYNSRGSYAKSNIQSPNLNYVWEQRKSNGRYSFHINKKHILVERIKKQLDEEGQETFKAYLALIENYAPFVQSGLLDSIQSKPSKDDSSLEIQVEKEEVKSYMTLFKKNGFSKDEVKNTLLEMASYRHLREYICELMENEYD